MACAIARDPNFIFTHIPTTGGTSLMSNKSHVPSVIKAHCGDLKILTGHRYLRNMIKNRNADDFFKFTIVRNPFDRMVSHWKVHAPQLSFYQFVEEVHHRRMPWLALRAQSRWVALRPPMTGKLLIDHAIRYERYEEGVNDTLARLGLPRVSLPHLRQNPRMKDYRRYYTSPRQIDLVAELYEEDIMNFNYSYDGGAK